jgi:histidinol-phosphatase
MCADDSMASIELQAALEAAHAAAEVIQGLYRRNLEVTLKADKSPVTEADVRAEQAIRQILQARFPDYGFYGEETGRHAMDAEAVWIVDPIDGTKCFVRGTPFFSTQIALWRGGRVVLGVSSAPVYGELAWAEEGRGAFLNGRPLRVSAINNLARATVSTGNLRHIAESPRWSGLGRLFARAYSGRGYGDFVHYHLLARGALEVVIESDIDILDIAAVSVIVREAGGTFTDLEGRAVGLETLSVLASNGLLHEEVRQMLDGVNA